MRKTLERSIGPDEAAKMLEKLYPGQRPIVESHIDRLAEEMKAGRFVLSSDAIVIICGMLANGQHRLHAIIRSGVTCTFLVMVTDEHAVFEVIDAGRKRTVANVVGGEYASIVQAATSWIIKYDQHNLSARGGKTTEVVRGYQIEFIKENKKVLQELAAVLYRKSRKKLFLTPSLALALQFIAMRYHKQEDVMYFVTALYEGDNSVPQAHLLRERLISERMSRQPGKRITPSYYTFALLIKAFNAYITNTSIKVLKLLDQEAYPRVYGEENALAAERARQPRRRMMAVA